MAGMPVPDHDLPFYPVTHESGRPFDAPLTLRRLQREQPVARVRLWDGKPAWLLTTYDPVRLALSDEQVSVDIMRPDFPAPDETAMARGRHSPRLTNIDDPAHARLRRMLQPHFTIKRMEARRPAIAAITEKLLDDFLAGPMPSDLYHGFALPLPSRVIGDLLGVPWEDHEIFAQLSDTMISHDSTPEQVVAAVDAISDYMSAVVQRKMSDPGDDLLSDLAVNWVRRQEITVAQAANMGMMLLSGGYETTANMITLSTVLLCQNPDQLERLRRHCDEAAWIARATEELLRYLTPPQWGRRRVVLEDMELEGHLISSGDRLIADNYMANRDPRVFADPEKLDLTRDARHHVAFGFGIHQCLGQPLARVELQVVLATLHRRMPALRLVSEVEDLQFRNDSIYGLAHLAVTW
jgi:cytochrome P450